MWLREETSMRLHGEKMMKGRAAAVAVLGLCLFSTAAHAFETKPDARCALYGEGFTYAESTGICVKISGFVEAGVYSGGGKHRDKAGPTMGVGVDVRKQTELGTLRIVIESPPL
jgi:hypothetical protein